MNKGAKHVTVFCLSNLLMTSITSTALSFVNYTPSFQRQSQLNAFPLRKSTNKIKSTLSRRVELRDSKDTSQKLSEEAEMYEVVLNELESEKLYGNSPRLCELDNLANWLRRGKLNIAPKYQRGYVWKQDRASRLIVTVLCNRIVPAIVLHERSKGIFDVVGELFSWFESIMIYFL